MIPDLLRPQAAVACLGVCAVLVAVSAVAAGRRRRRSIGADAAIANVGHSAAAPGFVRAQRRYVAALVIEGLALALVIVSLAVLVGRPASTRVEARAPKTRDIMLCLDVSDSMASVNADIVDAYSALVDDLDGDRIGLTIWSGSSASVFPLTDDYDLVTEQLAETKRALDELDIDFFTAAYAGEGSSLIGDGLAACVTRFDRTDAERHRSIVFATDNDLAGEPIVTLNQAADFAAERGITLYTLAPSSWGGNELLAELQAETERVGGSYHTIDDATAATAIVEEITATEGTETELPPTVVHTDQPTRFVVGGLVAAACIAVVSMVVRR